MHLFIELLSYFNMSSRV